MAIYDIDGKVISSGGNSSTKLVQNVFDISQNTEENVYVEHDTAYQHSTTRYWGGGVGSFTGKHFSYLIPVKAGEQYYLQNISLREVAKEASAIFYDENKEFTTQHNALMAGGYYITIPATASYMRVPVHADTVDTVMVLKGTAKPLDVFVPYNCYIQADLYGNIGHKSVDFLKLTDNARPHRFYGARVGCLGDSLTAMGNAWQARLMKKMGFASITNYGMSGTTVTSARGEGENTYRDRSPSMSDDLDLIIVMTSINDNGASYGVYNEANNTGTKADATDKSVNDVSTIAGAGLELIKILRNKYPNKDIVFFSHPHTHWGWSYGEADMYKEICGRHSVPFFDLLRYSSMDGKFNADKTHYFTDGVHLSHAGNDRVADYMTSCLKTL